MNGFMIVRIEMDGFEGEWEWVGVGVDRCGLMMQVLSGWRLYILHGALAEVVVGVAQTKLKHRRTCRRGHPLRS